MTEADLQTRFTRWLRHNVSYPLAYELKVTKGKRLPFSRIPEHQRLALHAAKHKGMCYKIPDVGQSPKPFDGFCLGGVEAVVGIAFNDQARTLYLLDIDEVLWLMEHRSSGSITEDDAKRLAWKIVEMK